METRREAVGFPCPRCSCERADILDMRLPQMELKCRCCGEEWAVEA